MAIIAWLIPSLLEGSGGHRTILQHADYLQNQGHHCVLYMESNGSTKKGAAEQISKLFGYNFSNVHLGWEEIAPADMVFATIWYSAKVVNDLTFPCKKCYFIQDFEAVFNPMGDGYLMAENSYRHPLYPVTIGRWLPAMLEKNFASQASYFDFCADTNVYHPVQHMAREKAICFIYQPDKPRRCAQLGLEALGIVKHHMPEVRIYLYGSKGKGRNIWFEHTNLGLLSLDECSQLYSRCQVGLCISSSNPSRIPFEMMATGLPVVEIHRENTLYDFSPDAMLLCEQTPESIASGLMELLRDPARTNAMGQAGIDFMAQRTIEHGLQQFGQIIDNLLEGRSPPHREAAVMYTNSAHVASNVPECNQRLTHHIQQDFGRLAFLPPLPRKIIRFIYHRARNLLS